VTKRTQPLQFTGLVSIFLHGKCETTSQFGNNLFLVCLVTVHSRQKSPRLQASRRRLTTSSAAAFSLTNNTVFPVARLSAITLAIVWLLPVPGGPSNTRFIPDLAASIASNWLLSESRMA